MDSSKQLRTGCQIDFFFFFFQDLLRSRQQVRSWCVCCRVMASISPSVGAASLSFMRRSTTRSNRDCRCWTKKHVDGVFWRKKPTVNVIYQNDDVKDINIFDEEFSENWRCELKTMKWRIWCNFSCAVAPKVTGRTPALVQVVNNELVRHLCVIKVWLCASILNCKHILVVKTKQKEGGGNR